MPLVPEWVISIDVGEELPDSAKPLMTAWTPPNETLKSMALAGGDAEIRTARRTADPRDVCCFAAVTDFESMNHLARQGEALPMAQDQALLRICGESDLCLPLQQSGYDMGRARHRRTTIARPHLRIMQLLRPCRHFFRGAGSKPESRPRRIAGALTRLHLMRLS